MTGIAVHSTLHVDLITCVHLWALKHVDNTSSFFKGTHKVLLEIRHGNRTEIISANRNSTGAKLSFERLATSMGFTSHTRDVR